MSCLACLYPTIAIPQTVTPFCRVNILGILSSISNETTELTVVLTVNLENEPGIRGDHSVKLFLGLVSGRREGSAGWISASGWLDPPYMLKIRNLCFPKECSAAAGSWTLCYLLCSVPKITAHFC